MRMLLSALLLFWGVLLQAESPFCCKGRVDAGPAFFRVMVQEDGEPPKQSIFTADAPTPLSFFSINWGFA